MTDPALLKRFLLPPCLRLEPFSLRPKFGTSSPICPPSSKTINFHPFPSKANPQMNLYTQFRLFFPLFAFALSALGKPANVLLILSDDHRYDFMSFMEESPEFLETPNLDRIAKEGSISPMRSLLPLSVPQVVLPSLRDNICDTTGWSITNAPFPKEPCSFPSIYRTLATLPDM